MKKIFLESWLHFLGYVKWTKIEDYKVDKKFKARVQDADGKIIYTLCCVKQDSRFPYWSRVKVIKQNTEDKVKYPIKVTHLRNKIVE